MKVWLDGRLVDAEEARVSVFDHGLTTGDGVFETVKVTGGRPFALSRHLDRLARSAAGLGLAVPGEEGMRRAVAEVLAADPDLTEARVRITVTGGVAPLGSERGAAGPTVVVAAAPLPDRSEPGDVVVVPWTRNERGALAGVKSTSYAENVRALSYAQERGADEAVFANTAGNLCEATGSNVFVVSDGRLVTPPLTSGCLAGVTRALLLEWTDAAEADVPLPDFARADEAFLASTTRDVQPIRTIDGRPLAECPGPFTRKAYEVFRSRSAADADP